MTIKHLSSGFTLVELLVVITVLGVLATTVVGILNPFAQIGKARDAQRKSDLKQLQTAIELYNQDTGEYPTDSVMNSILTASNPTWGTYMTKVPKDPSGKKYYYVRDSVNGYRLYASLDRNSDSQKCTSTGTACNTNNCSGTCNYGVSSSNLTP